MKEEDYVIEAPPVPVGTFKPRGGGAAKGVGAGAAVATHGLQALPSPAGPTSGKGKGKKGANPRDGKARKGKDGEAASFVPGDAAAPGKGAFDPQEICELMDLWWERDGGDNFVLQTVVKEKPSWARWPMGAVKLHIRKEMSRLGRYIALAPRKGSDEVLSEVDEVLLHARIHRCVDEVVPALAGFRSGIVRLTDGREVVIRRSPALIEGAEGEWGMIRAMVENLLKLEGGIDQCDYFYAWCKIAYESVRFGSPGSFKPGHALVLAGPVGSGKSRLQVNIITALLGGRSGDPTAFLTGDDSFNSDLIGSEHLMMEELLTSSWSAADRVNLSESIKRMVANENKRLRLMRTDPITVQPFWRLTLSMNDDPDKMRAFPMLTPDFRDKVVMLLVQKRALPMPTATPEEQRLFNERIASEMPAFIHWLTKVFVIPEKMLWDAKKEESLARFGFGAFQHPQLSDALFDDSPAAQLLEYIDQAEIGKIMGNDVKTWSGKLWEMTHPDNHSGKKLKGGAWQNMPGLWYGTAEDLEELLSGTRERRTSSVALPAKRLVGKGSIRSMLQRLAQDCPDRVAAKKCERFRGWMIWAPEEPATDGQTAAVAGGGGGGGDDAAAAQGAN